MTQLPWNDSYYGSYRTRTFSDIFPDAATFIDQYTNNGISPLVKNETVTTLYYMLYARYGNSHIASSDENQFKYKVWTTIFMYGPTWAKRLELQGEVRKLTIDEAMLGAKTILNHSYNPSTAPSTSALEELTTINDQNTQQFKKSKLDAIGYLASLLETDVTAYFLDMFKKLFLTVVAPQEPLWYETIIEGDNINDSDD